MSNYKIFHHKTPWSSCFLFITSEVNKNNDLVSESFAFAKDINGRVHDDAIRVTHPRSLLKLINKSQSDEDFGFEYIKEQGVSSLKLYLMEAYFKGQPNNPIEIDRRFEFAFLDFELKEAQPMTIALNIGDIPNLSKLSSSFSKDLKSKISLIETISKEITKQKI